MKQSDFDMVCSFLCFSGSVAVAMIWGDYAKAAYWMAAAAYWRITYGQDVKEPEA